MANLNLQNFLQVQMLHSDQLLCMMVMLDEYTLNDHESMNNNILLHAYIHTYIHTHACYTLLLKLYHRFNDNCEVSWFLFVHKSHITPSMLQLACTIAMLQIIISRLNKLSCVSWASKIESERVQYQKMLWLCSPDAHIVPVRGILTMALWLSWGRHGNKVSHSSNWQSNSRR